MLAQYDYVLTPTGHRAQISEANGRVISYGYDTLNRLISEQVIDAVNGNYQVQYHYDDVGNRLSSNIDGVETAYSYDKNDRLLTAGGAIYQYDLQGNLIGIADGIEQTQHQYNDQNQLIRTQTLGNSTEPEIRFSYDAKGIRVTRTHNGVTTQYLVDHNRDYAQVLSEVQHGQPTVTYTYGHDLLKQQRGVETHYFLTDGLGSTRALTDGAGQVTDQYDYNAFGELQNHTGTTENQYRYTGEQYDAALDAYYLRARYYSPNVGRFTQMDTWLGKPCSPITLNKYLYANVDPVLNVDPSGNMSLSSLMTSLNVRGLQSGSSQVSLRFTLKKVGKEVACVIVEQAVIDFGSQAILSGIYLVSDGSGRYVGQSNNIKKRLRQHAAQNARKISSLVENAMGIFQVNGGKNSRRIIEQFLIDYMREVTGERGLTNTVNSIADNPRSHNSKKLRKILNNKLDICP